MQEHNRLMLLNPQTLDTLQLLVWHFPTPCRQQAGSGGRQAAQAGRQGGRLQAGSTGRKAGRQPKQAGRQLRQAVLIARAALYLFVDLDVDAKSVGPSSS